MYKLLDLDIEATGAVTDNTRKNFKKLGKFLENYKTNLEAKYGSINENFNKILTSADILKIFHAKEGPLFRELLTAAKNNYYKYLIDSYNSGKDYSESEARDIIFTTISRYTGVREQWSEKATDSLYDNLFKNK